MGNSNLRKKILESFNDCLAFPEKWFVFLVLSIRRFKRCTNMQSLRTFGRLKNKFIVNSNTVENFLESFMVCLVFPGKWFCSRRANLAFYNFVRLFNHPEDSI